MNHTGIQTISDKNGSTTGVIVPIELWRKMQSELKQQKKILARSPRFILGLPN
jgi:hypothetical protein